MTFSAIGCMIAAIALDGASGREVEVAATVDANNVRAGDLVTLTVFVRGADDPDAIRPPAIAKSFDPSEWRVDDATAKAETAYAERQVFMGIQRIPMERRLTYHIRPLKTGIVYVPALEFSCPDAASGEPYTSSTAPIPVGVRPGRPVAAADEEPERAGPRPDGLFVDLVSSPWGSAVDISEDTLFAWRKACADPSPGAFAPFDFPEARLNEAACELMTNNWQRAEEIYTKLEWRIGQTPAIERGLVAALARQMNDPSAGLPLWRRALRPVLRFAMAGRIAFALGFLAALAIAIWFVRRRVRALASIALALGFASAASAADPFGGADPFEMLERHRRQMDAMMQQAFGGGLSGGGIQMNMGGGLAGGMRMSINGQSVPDAEIRATLDPDKKDLTVGEPFNFILSLEMPKDCTVEPSQFAPSRMAGFSVTGPLSRLADGRTANTNNVVRRLSIPVRYDAPFEGRLTSTVGGMLTRRMTFDNGRGGRQSSTFSQNFQADTAPIWMNVKPLPGVNRPDDYTGAVLSSVAFDQKPVRTRVATNDVVVLECRLAGEGYMPPGVVPGGLRERDGVVSFRRYFIADGSPKTDRFSFSYYDVNARDFKRVTYPGVDIEYVSEEEAEESRPEVCEEAPPAPSDMVALRFAPRDDSPVVGRFDPGATDFETTERHGAWCRVDDGEKAGWVKKGDLP